MKVLFIHIPKTAGSSLKSFFKNTLEDFVVQANSADQLSGGDPHLVRVRDLSDIEQVLQAHRGLALHVDSSFDQVRRTTDFRSLASLLFEPDHYRYFQQFTILTMFRHPFRQFLSEYGFLQRMKTADRRFLPDLDLSGVERFLEQRHPNAVLHFLLERELHNPRTITSDDLERVKERIAHYPIHVGIHERFDESMARFARILGRHFSASDLPVLNAGSAAVSVDPALETEFSARNQLDLELYEYVVRRFDSQPST